MALVNGFLNTTQFGRGVSSVGEDMAEMSREQTRLANQRELMNMKTQRDQDLLELKAELGLIRARGAGSGGGGGGGGSWNQENLPDEVMAALSGAGSVPEFQQGRNLYRTGVMPKDAGFPMAEVRDPLGEAPGEGVASIDQPQARAGISSAAKGYQQGLMTRSFGPGRFKELQEGTTIGRERELTLDAPDVPAAIQGGRRINAHKGKGEFDVKDGTRLNEFTGDTQTTDVGASTVAKNKAAASKDYTSASTDKASTVHSVVAGGDGRMYIVTRDNRQIPMRAENGQPLTSREYAETRRKIESEIAKNPMYMGDRNKGKRQAEVERQMTEIYPPSTSAAPRAEPKAAAGGGKTIDKLPPGAKKIGTSGGKDVYETPDGRRFKAE